MAKSPIIDFDLECVGCGYNLRGLGPDQRCPECGQWIDDSLDEVRLARFEAAETERRSKLNPVANECGCAVDAVVYVLDAVAAVRRRAAWLAGPDAGPGEIQVTAGQLCDGIRELAFDEFAHRGEALLRLRAWGIESSEDVGRIIYALVSVGHLHTSPEDSPSDFDGLFTLATLFETPEEGRDDPDQEPTDDDA